MRGIRYFSLLFLIQLLLPLKVQATGNVVINEFSSKTNSDWVELYNTTDQTVDLNNYTLSDNSTSGNIKTFTCILAPHGFTVLVWSNKLNNAGDTIYLKQNDQVTDCVSYGDGNGSTCPEKTEVDLPALNDGETGARQPDGGGWQITSSITKDAPNDGSQKDEGAICTTPTATPKPTLTPKPTSTPKPSSTPKPTKKPTSTPKPIAPTSKPTNQNSSLTTTLNATNNSSSVLGESTDEDQPEINVEIIDLTTRSGEPSATPSTEPEEKTKGPILPKLLTGLGLFLLLGGGAPLVVQEIKTRRSCQPS